MSTLKEFLIENQVEKLEGEIKPSERFPEPFKVQTLTHKQYDGIMSLATDKKTKVLNSVKFHNLLIVESCIEPSFKEAAFIQQLGVDKPEDAVAKVFLIGEAAEFARQIVKFNGFDTDKVKEDIEEAKNF